MTNIIDVLCVSNCHDLTALTDLVGYRLSELGLGAILNYINRKVCSYSYY